MATLFAWLSWAYNVVYFALMPASWPTTASAQESARAALRLLCAQDAERSEDAAFDTVVLDNASRETLTTAVTGRAVRTLLCGLCARRNSCSVRRARYWRIPDAPAVMLDAFAYLASRASPPAMLADASRARPAAALAGLHAAAFPAIMDLILDVAATAGWQVLGSVHLSSTVRANMRALERVCLDARACVSVIAAVKDMAAPPHRRGHVLRVHVGFMDGHGADAAMFATMDMDFLFFDRTRTHTHKHADGATSSSTQPLRQPADVVAMQRFTPELARSWSRITGDFNPIHTSRVCACVCGYAHTVAHGMAVVHAALPHLMPTTTVADAVGIQVHVEFVRPALLPGEFGISRHSHTHIHAHTNASGAPFDVFDVRSGKACITGTITPVQFPVQRGRAPQ